MLLQISIRSSVDSAVTEAVAPNYFQPLPKIFCTTREKIESLKSLHANGEEV